MARAVALFLPNLLCYARILLAFWGLHVSSDRPLLAVALWFLSGSFDLIDGILARALHQTSTLGILLDIMADNILRTTCWMAAAATNPSYQIVACIIISMEWITMVSTQLHATQSGTHWKASRQQDPWLLQMIFANNFRTPLGTWCIYGLFTAPIFAYGSSGTNELMAWIPFWGFCKYVAYTGRFISMLAEVWLILGYMSLVIEQDDRDSDNNKES